MKKIGAIGLSKRQYGLQSLRAGGLQQLLMRAYPIVCLSVTGTGAAKTLRMDMLRIHLPADFESQKQLGYRSLSSIIIDYSSHFK